MMSKTQILTCVALFLIAGTAATVALRQRDPNRRPLISPVRFRAWWMMVAGLLLASLLGSNPKIGSLPQLAGFAMLSALAMRQFFSHLKAPPARHTKIVCYLAVIAQYYWVYIHWYGFFVVFIPVFMFLYLPVTDGLGKSSTSPLSARASLHWVLMTCVFCLSHAAFLLIFPGGKGLLFFVVLVTEVADVIRMLLSRNDLGRKWSPLLSIVGSVVTAWLIGPAFTPLTPEHIVLTGLVLGAAGSIGHRNIATISKEMRIEPGGPLERIESLAYTAPLFLHGYRYFDYPIVP
jgi:phosphatidate cytidylyltransferase